MAKKNVNKIIKNKGIVKTKDIVKEKISKPLYYKFLEENNYEKVAPGMYVAEDSFFDQLSLIHERCKEAVISHDEALLHYGLIEREPFKPTFTIYSGYNVSRLKKYGYKIFYIKKEYLNLGKVNVKDNFGNIVPMYDLERTICDLIRNRSYFEIQDFTAALKSYARRSDKKISILMDYAKKLRIEKLVRQYLEVLL